MSEATKEIRKPKNIDKFCFKGKSVEDLSDYDYSILRKELEQEYVDYFDKVRNFVYKHY